MYLFGKLKREDEYNLRSYYWQTSRVDNAMVVWLQETRNFGWHITVIIGDYIRVAKFKSETEYVSTLLEAKIIANAFLCGETPSIKHATIEPWQVYGLTRNGKPICLPNWKARKLGLLNDKRNNS